MGFGDMDEHDQPTEPAIPIFPTPSSASIANEAPTVAGDEEIPMPKPSERPFPDISSPGSPYPVYPVLPPAPVINNGWKQPPGGVMPFYPAGSTPTTGAHPKRSSVPLLVGMFFVAVQLLLLVRFLLKIFALSENIPWVGLIYTLSSLFVLPFRLLLQNFALPLTNALEIYTLLAILIYGIISRLLVRFLKALLNSR